MNRGFSQAEVYCRQLLKCVARWEMRCEVGLRTAYYPQGRTAYWKNIFVLGCCLGSDRAAGVTVGVSRRPSMLCGGEREVMYV